MSEDTYTEPGITKTFHPDQDKESIVDIYVSAESLRVYDSPWLEEGTLQNVTRPAVAQHPVSVVSASSWRRNCSRTNSAIQCVVYLLLLVLIVVLICLRDQLKDKTNWRSEGNQSLAYNMTLNNTELSKETDHLRKLCERKPKKCKNLDWPNYS
ncbi:hypothetical protein D5F01_LYC00840 [Larimichthys crocea]|uniref:Uncharacterized protein n=1 Tax=Larimichthys crocea TaxID=215358 RepID=A0A6G0JAX2_LARCR|nr:hypothetical protein D5F01_LYC00840 [Larimichthys crocea]